MPPTVPYASISAGGEFQWQADTPGAAGQFRQIERRAQGLAATSAVKIRLLPVGNVTYTLDNFPNLELDNVAVPDIAGDPVDLKKIKGLLIIVAPFDDSEPASGTVTVTPTNIFGSGGVAHPMGVGDVHAITRAAGVTLGGSAAITIAVSSGVNLRVEVILIGDTNAAAS